MKTLPTLARLRGQMMLPRDGTVLLNAGTMSPTPRPVFEEAQRIRETQASNPHKFFFELQGQYIRAARRSLAKYIRVDADDLFLFPNVTISLNHVAHALDCAVRDGREKRKTILVSSLEYGSIGLVWRNARSLDVQIVEIDECDSWEEIVDAFRRKMSKHVLAVCMSHVAQPIGRVLPVKSLAKLARDRGIYSVVDGAHATGNLDVELRELDIDAYGTNLHKWMMGLANSGFLHVSKAMKDLLCPLMVSWGSKELRPDNREQDAKFFGGTQLQGALEFWGCVDRVPQMVIPQTVEFHRQVGLKRIQSRMQELRSHLIERLGSKLVPMTWDDPESQSALTAFNLGRIDLQQVWRSIWKKRLAVGMTRVREDLSEHAPNVPPRDGYLRVSTAWFNTEQDIEHLGEVVDKLWRRTGLRPDSRRR